MSLFFRKNRLEMPTLRFKGSVQFFNTQNYSENQVFAIFNEDGQKHDNNAKISKIRILHSDTEKQFSITSDEVCCCFLDQLKPNFGDFSKKKFFTYDVVFLLTALENKHLLPKRHKGAFLGYPASETCITEPGRGEKGIPKSGNDSNIGPVPRVTEERSERARSITLPPISENQWLQNVGLRRGLKEPLDFEKPAGRGAYTYVEGLVASFQYLMKVSEGLDKTLNRKSPNGLIISLTMSVI